MIEFIHCGDLHLGCNPNRIEERYEDFFDAFNRLIDYTIANKVKIILVCGDFFHLKVINSKTLSKTIDSLKKAKNNDIDIIVIEGNHDQAFYVDEDSWLSFLNNQNYIKLLKTDINEGKLLLSTYNGKLGNIVETENYRIIGINYLGGTTEKYIEELEEQITSSSKFTVLMMHAAVNRLRGQDMGDVKSDLFFKLQDKIDYVALGHIHNRYEINDFIYNPGSLENIRLRDGKRSNDKGYYHVKVVDNKKKIDYIQSKPRTILYHNLDLSNIKLPDDVLSIIDKNEFTLNKGEMLELNLYGKVNFNPHLINTEQIKNKLKEKYNLLYLEINNYINLITEIGKYNEVDIENIVENLIVEEIKINYPETEDPNKTAAFILNLTNKISNDIDEEAIIEMLFNEEENI